MKYNSIIGADEADMDAARRGRAGRQAEERGEQGIRRKGDGDGGRGGRAGRQIRAEVGQHCCCPASSLASRQFFP